MSIKGRLERQSSMCIELATKLALMISAQKTSTTEFSLLKTEFEELSKNIKENEQLLKDVIEETELDIDPSI
jgi:hypothetical protein